MTVQSTNVPANFDGFATAISSLFTKIMQNSAIASSAGTRNKQIEALKAKSDVELAEMGLQRNDIVLHVFRDLMYI